MYLSSFSLYLDSHLLMEDEELDEELASSLYYKLLIYCDAPPSYHLSFYFSCKTRTTIFLLLRMNWKRDYALIMLLFSQCSLLVL